MSERCIALGVDASHDFHHIERVWKVAVQIALSEGIDRHSDLMETIEVAALLHDVEDHKYSTGGDEGGVVERFLLNTINYNPVKVGEILQIIDGVSYSKEAAAVTGDGVVNPPSLALRIVQDADRLDAVGAIGIARCLTFGGAKNRSLFHVGDYVGDDKHEKVKVSNTTINHFFHKLLKIKDKMKTAEGRRIGEERHLVLIQYLRHLFGEMAVDVEPFLLDFLLPKKVVSREEETIQVVVVGAHLEGMPLHHQLTSRNAKLVKRCKTAPVYTLLALANSLPPKPALVHVGEGSGHSIEIEIYEMTHADMGSFLLLIPPPLGIGTIEVDDGSLVRGFICEPRASNGATDVSAFGGWRAYINHLSK